VAFTTLSPVPWWGLFVYTTFFGAVPYFALRSMQRGGMTVRSTWIWFAAFFLIDALIEQPIIHSGLYHYYGDPPFLLFGFPLYWMFINAGGPMLAATRAAASLTIALGWPIFSALNAQAARPVMWAAASLTMALGLVLVQAVATLGVLATAPGAPQVEAAVTRDGRLTSTPE
jgi:hypothetical protein